MRQRELRREDRRPVGGLRRAPQKPAGRRHDCGVADPEQGPGDQQRRPSQTGRDGGVGPALNHAEPRNSAASAS